ncbi:MULTISPECIES: NmrA family NAD(P)-binding protein [Streptomyces]|uniref:NAD(P)H-binding protein n=1 Tax=Streptomyces thermoviolaceus subsp. thermoviolaceus TaxID=66860 RepID=A0ABX0YXT6_STRTL|nr:NmrA family NAD(P)-binding protein [Streptomyces thermoviolaceus]NJP17472.1 NAD(P)H-binding protein [Streptomyces thermoviolaceus subsp. thermoviolaceus]WTD50577.1 NmrA family NAD(P)-binding protein [Streptomyces thermoviolaceus]GGV84311.1 NAD(P)-dependent oxidoreductase [Streptomyces thermoviolaceus subsp. apingens]GHB14178.1 NAD(P)-dependent oxidoreductase [Streptomyces thermoviolaceus subsp. thermoviolaceus]
MAASNLVLVTGAGRVGRAILEELRARDVPVRVMVRRDDERAADLRTRGAEVVVGDLTRPETVAAALENVGRMYFAMPVSPDHLLAATVVATVAREHGHLTGLVAMSQMTVSQMTATSTAESHQQRLHWLAEQVLNWSGLPVVHVRPTVFLNNPLFTSLAAQSIKANGTIALPFGTGRTSPVAVDDVARVAATVLCDPAPHIGHIYELTGPRTVDMTELAQEFSRALGREVTYVDVPPERWRTENLASVGLPPHVEEHIVTMARLHRENRYDRTSDDVQRVTGVPAQSIEAFVAARKDFYLG